jgi:hypothetical protein
MELSPELILTMWAAGIAIGAVPISLWRIVGSGFYWLIAGSSALMGAGALVFGVAPGTLVGLLSLVAAASLVRRSVWMALAFSAAAAGFLTTAIASGGVLLTVTGAVTLGAVTDEMLLGHWYLIDPRLPRWALKSLDGAASVGLLADAGVLGARGALTWGSDTQVVGWAFVGLVVMSALLMAGVWGALRERGYSGVMAATGLSYLAVLTVVGATISGRSLLGDGSSLLSG